MKFFGAEAVAGDSAWLGLVPPAAAGCGYSTVMVTVCAELVRLRTTTWGTNVPACRLRRSASGSAATVSY
jgi:hypothetical protein